MPPLSWPAACLLLNSVPYPLGDLGIAARGLGDSQLVTMRIRRWEYHFHDFWEARKSKSVFPSTFFIKMLIDSPITGLRDTEYYRAKVTTLRMQATGHPSTVSLLSLSLMTYTSVTTQHKSQQTTRRCQHTPLSCARQDKHKWISHLSSVVWSTRLFCQKTYLGPCLVC